MHGGEVVYAMMIDDMCGQKSKLFLPFYRKYESKRSFGGELIAFRLF